MDLTPPAYIDPTDALSAVPAAGSRRGVPIVGHLRFYYGPMDCGKSALALQVDHNQARQGRRGLLLVHLDRSGKPQISSRIGITREASEVGRGGGWGMPTSTCGSWSAPVWTT